MLKSTYNRAPAECRNSSVHLLEVPNEQLRRTRAAWYHGRIRLSGLGFSVIFILVTMSCSNTTSSPSWKLSSPDKKIVVTVVQAQLPAPYSPDELNLYYNVQYSGEEVINNSPLGITMEGPGGDFVQKLKFVNQTLNQIDETYVLPAGKTSLYQNHANELVLSFRNTADQDMDVIFRAYDDGIAYSYHFPGSGERSITGERSGFRIPLGSSVWAAWWKDDYESFYEEGVVGQSFLKGQKPAYPYEEFSESVETMTDDVGFPALFHTPAGQWLLVTEAAVYGDYCYSRLNGDDRAAGLFEVGLDGNNKVSSALPWNTPWRVAVIGATLGPIVETVLVENLNPPCETQDISWIEPGVFTSSWWYGRQAPEGGEGRPSGVSTRQIYADFAHEMGWSYPAQRYFDYRELGDLPFSEIEEWVRETAEQGTKHIFADFIDSDSQKAVQFYDDFASLGMKYKMMVKYHGATLPRGQRRRWPNLVGWEAVRGSEYYKFGDPPRPVDTCTLPYTRNVVGSMDFTPPTFYGPASPPKRTNSNAHELALVVIFECALPQWWDHPDSYRKVPAAMDFLKKCPVAWDETRFIDGYPGKYVCMARRKGDDWFIGGISALPAHDVSIPLSFLGSGSYSLELHRDGDAQLEIVSEKRVVTSGSVLQLRLIDNGGFSGAIFAAE